MRENLDILKDRFGADAVIVPGFIRSDLSMTDGNTNMQFLVKKGEKIALAPERLLDFKDAFAITRYGVLLVFETVAAPGTGKLETYPNATVFAGTGLTAASLEKLYNGSLGIKVGQDQLIEAYPTHNFRVVRTTQQASSTTKSEQLPADGFASAQPMLILKGNEKLDVIVTRPATSGEGVQLTDTSTNIVKVVFFAQGYTIYGAGGK
ncbi:MAG: hypothetical protein Q8L07_04220 [Sediminibacterium sp.]|nr:hypothetical protein [Sediminibacterium sp.]